MHTQPVPNCPQPESPWGQVVNPPLTHIPRSEADLRWTAPEVVDALQWALSELHETHCGQHAFHVALRALRRTGGAL